MKLLWSALLLYVTASLQCGSVIAVSGSSFESDDNNDDYGGGGVGDYVNASDFNGNQDPVNDYNQDDDYPDKFLSKRNILAHSLRVRSGGSRWSNSNTHALRVRRGPAAWSGLSHSLRVRKWPVNRADAISGSNNDDHEDSWAKRAGHRGSSYEDMDSAFKYIDQDLPRYMPRRKSNDDILIHALRVKKAYELWKSLQKRPYSVSHVLRV